MPAWRLLSILFGKLDERVGDQLGSHYIIKVGVVFDADGGLGVGEQEHKDSIGRPP